MEGTMTRTSNYLLLQIFKVQPKLQSILLNTLPYLAKYPTYTTTLAY